MAENGSEYWWSKIAKTVHFFLDHGDSVTPCYEGLLKPSVWRQQYERLCEREVKAEMFQTSDDQGPLRNGDFVTVLYLSCGHHAATMQLPCLEQDSQAIGPGVLLVSAGKSNVKIVFRSCLPRPRSVFCSVLFHTSYTFILLAHKWVWVEHLTDLCSRTESSLLQVYVLS